MTAIIVTVYGHARTAPCEYVRKTFYAWDEADFGEQVAAWERENDIFEWHRTSTV